MDRYEVWKQIGRGSFGDVSLVVKKKTGQKFALKRLFGKYDWDGFVTFCELQSLVQTHSHPNIIRLYEVIKHQSSVNFVIEYMGGGNLHSTINKLRRQQQQQNYFFTEMWIRTLACHVLSAIDHMHRKGFAHRDMKPENILLSHDSSSSPNHIPVFKVADFSLARRIVDHQCSEQQSGDTNNDHDLTPYVSTRWYRSPEVLQRNKYGLPMDMFAIGCIVAETYALEALFPGESELDQLSMLLKHDPLNKRELRELLATTTTGTTPSGVVISEDGYDLMEKLLRFHQEQRCTAHEALQHPFVRGVPAVGPTSPIGNLQTQQQQQKLEKNCTAIAETTTTTKTTTNSKEAAYTPPPTYRDNSSITRQQQEQRGGSNSATTTTTAYTTPAATTTRVSSTTARHNYNSNGNTGQPAAGGGAGAASHVVTTEQQRFTMKRTYHYNNNNATTATGSTATRGSNTTTTATVIYNPYNSSKKRKNDYVSPSF